MASFEPVYIKAFQSGLLHEKVKSANKILNSCVLCPRECRINRIEGQLGICKTGKNAWLNAYKAHLGEETPLIGKNGSGTFFFTHCNLLCIFCQNYELSHEGRGKEISNSEMAEMMLILQEAECPNIHFISPTHVVPQILSALEIAVQKGLSIPLVYNSSGYESIETLKILDGIIDIYMPDFKFWDPDISEKLCSAYDYPEKARAAIIEMHRQVGDLVLDESGKAHRGLLLRHLIMPSGLAGTQNIMHFVAQEISPNTYVNIMPQFKPHGRSYEVKELMNCITEDDYADTLKAAREAGIHRIDPRPGKVFMGF
ncbi:MAG: radical SAM protein [Desulfobacterales bacterium]|nr:radical SAM protein [Desulfobacterales bacterium]